LNQDQLPLAFARLLSLGEAVVLHSPPYEVRVMLSGTVQQFHQWGCPAESLEVALLMVYVHVL